jgi:hypothetical protein
MRLFLLFLYGIAGWTGWTQLLFIEGVVEKEVIASIEEVRIGLGVLVLNRVLREGFQRILWLEI